MAVATSPKLWGSHEQAIATPMPLLGLHSKFGKIEGKEVDHIDSDKTNNKLSNLQLISHKDNCIKSRKQRGYIKPDFSNGKYSIKKKALLINKTVQPMEPKDYILYRRSKGLETYKHERLFKKLGLL